MGLEAFDIAPDNKGGRKEKDDEEEEQYGRRVEGTFNPEVDTEEWWRERIEEVCGELNEDDDFETNADKIGDLASATAEFPVDVRKRLHKHGIFETDWEEVLDYYPDHVLDSRYPGYDGGNYSPTVESDPWKSSVDIPNTGSPDSGLASIVENAKK